MTAGIDHSPVPPHVPTHEELHRDISLANQYRLEFIKHTMSIAAGVFVFTVTFRREIIGTHVAALPQLIAAGWIALLVSLLGGLGQMAGWDRYYISYRDHKTDYAGGEEARSSITFFRRCAMVFQLLAFFFGLGCVAIYCIANL
jgi:hypothetical protein